MDHRIRCISSTLKVGKDQRRVLVDRLCARAASEEEKDEGEVTSVV